MAKQPNDKNPPDEPKKPAPGDPKKTKMSRPASKPTMMKRDEDDESEAPAVPNMSLEEAAEDIPVLESAEADDEGSDVLMMEPEEDIPVLEAAEPASAAELLPMDDEDVLAKPGGPAVPGSKSHVTAELAPPSPPPARAEDEVLGGEEAVPVVQPPSSDVFGAPVEEVAEAQAVSDIAEAQPVSDVAEAEPVFDDLEAQPVDVTGADVPGADVTGAEHVLGDDLAEAQPASAVSSGAIAGSDVLAAEVGSGAVIGEEALEPGSRPSARVDSPIRTEPDEEALDLGAEPSAARKMRKIRDLEGTEEVPASSSKWDDVSGVSDLVRSAQQEETAAFDAMDDSSAVNLGGDIPSKPKGASGIDAVAEALESGVNLDDELPAAPSVEFDDILADEAAELPPKKPARAKKKTPAEEEPVASELTDDDLESMGKKKKKKPTAAEIEEEAAALFGDDEEEAVAAPVDDDEEAVAVSAVDDEVAAVDDEEAAVAAMDEEEEAPPKKVGKRRDTAPKDRPIKPPPSGPGCFGQLIRAGFFMIVGMLLLAGAAVGAWFVDPNLVDDTYRQVASTKKPVPQQTAVAPTLTAAERGAQKLLAGQYDEALQEVVGDDEDPAAKALRGEARFLKQAKDAKKPLSKDDPEVKKSLEELRAGKNDTLANQIELSLDAQGKLGASDLLLREVHDVARKAGLKAEPNELPKVLSESLASKKQADTLLKDIGTAMAGAKVIPTPDDLTADKVDKVLKDYGETQTTLNGVNKLLKDAELKEGPKGVAELLALKKDSEEKLNEVNKVLADGKVKDPGAKGVQEVLLDRVKVTKDRDELDAATKAAYDELVKAKVVPADGDPRKQLALGVKLAREKGESPLGVPLTQLGASLSGMGLGVTRLVEKGVDASLLAAELGIFKAREPFIETPAQKLDTYAALLQDRNRKDPKQLGAILRETQWVLSGDPKIAPEARAKALYVTGLALRNDAKFTEARKALNAAVTHPGAKGTAWVTQAGKALEELTDARAYYLPQIATLEAAGNLKGALDETDQALKVLPGDGRLLAERGLLRLDAQRGKLKLDAPAQAEIRKDAEAAVKTENGAADGAYLLGLLEESLDQFGKAEEYYRQALKAHKGSDDEASRYRVALARVLLRDRPAVAAPPAAEDAPEKKKTESRLSPAAAPVYMHPLTALVVSAAVGQVLDEQEPETENAQTAKRIRESIDLAKELATSKDAKIREQGYAALAQATAKAGAQLTSATCLELSKDLLSRPDPKVRGFGYLVMGQGLVKQGRRTEGLKLYTRGLELVHPGLESREITRMVEEHPAFQHPDAANKPNPLLAEKHFGYGLHQYWARRYPEAEVQFKQALDYFSQDARYAYFLGLAQLAQKSLLKRDQAYFSFERGAQLEAQSRPGIAEINMSLERVQGELRQLLNSYRFKGVMAATP